MTFTKTCLIVGILAISIVNQTNSEMFLMLNEKREVEFGHAFCSGGFMDLTPPENSEKKEIAHVLSLDDKQSKAMTAAFDFLDSNKDQQTLKIKNTYLLTRIENGYTFSSSSLLFIYPYGIVPNKHTQGDHNEQLAIHLLFSGMYHIKCFEWPWIWRRHASTSWR